MAVSKYHPKLPIDFTANRIICVLLAAVFLSLFSQAGKANAETRTLKLYYLHTGEKTKVTYYKNGKYLSSGLKKANWALRDWRKNEPTKMDPKLLDLVYEAYRKSGAKSWIHVISGYRSPKTNNALRKRGGGQAKNSQHTRGKAMDFFLPGVKVSKLREIGLKMGIGGVGYYPRSGSPFVHLDTGNVRHWPRMSRKQLARVFPRGKTMHVPTDGKPLAGYKAAVASYKRKKSSGKIVTQPDKKELNFFQRLAARTKDDEDEDKNNNNTVAVPRAVKTTVTKPKPKPEPIKPAVETLIAELPSRQVPIPISAPRNNILKTGTEIVVAALPPETPVAVEVPVVETQPVIEETVEPVFTQDFTIPIPAKRPTFNAPVDAPILTANNEPSPEAPTPASDQTLLAALTPSEIQDIRRSTTPGENAIPRPSNSVGTAPNGLPLAKTFPVTQSSAIEIVKEAPEQTTQPAIVTASLEPAVTNTQDNIVVPASKPIATPTIIPEPSPVKPNTTELALAIVEDKTLKAEQRAIAAIEEATTSNQPEIIETVEQQEARLAFVIPVPTRSPRQPIIEAPIVVASLEPKTKQTVQPKPTITASSKPLKKRTVSLDKLSAPQDNSSSIGQYALSASVNIRDIGTVQAPAYGRNMIRNVPSTIFVEGFRTNLLPGTQLGFSGKAIVFNKFARLNK